MNDSSHGQSIFNQPLNILLGKEGQVVDKIKIQYDIEIFLGEEAVEV
jgi:hypothetical protein